MADNFSLESRVSLLEKKIALLESRIRMLEISDPGKSIDLSNANTRPKIQPAVVKKSISINDNFIEEFNALSELTGYESRTARRNFAEKFQIQAFSCSNYEYRMTHPDAKPEFKDESSGKGTFWAIPAGEKFFVVPNLKTYEEQYHLTGGMQEAFASNFIGGKTYDKIQLIKPATFAKDLNGWKILSRGELKLR